MLTLSRSAGLACRRHGSLGGMRVIERSLFVQPGDETPTLTVSEILDGFYKRIGASKYFNRAYKDERKDLMELLPKDRSELPSRKMSDSFVSAIVPLKTDLALRDRYANCHGGVRTGRLFEDLDAMALFCCYNHILNPRSEGQKNPYSCVTALVDRLQFSPAQLRPDEDIRLSAHVSWVGRSSMEISLLVDQKDTSGVWHKITDALFVFVARDPLNQGAALVNPLEGTTEAEKKFIEEGEARMTKRRQEISDSLTKKPPTQQELELIHELCTQSAAPHEVKMERMSQWEMNTLLLCHPEHRNRFNKIFGGFIMRKAYEIAHSTVFLYSKARPKIIHIDDILFQKPVELGSLLLFNAAVAYVEDKYIHVSVSAQVLDPETKEKTVTNVFHYTFLSQSENPPPGVYPETYLEAIKYLDARRHFNGMKA